MDRLLNIGAAGILICIVAAIVLNQVNDPFQSRRRELEQRLTEIRPAEETEDAFEWQFEEWNASILGKGAVWQELVPPPPPPPPAAPPAAPTARLGPDAG